MVEQTHDDDAPGPKFRAGVGDNLIEQPAKRAEVFGDAYDQTAIERKFRL
jgi:hypothetical protein